MITSLGGDVKPLCRRQSGQARCDQNMDGSGCKSAPLHADVQSHLSGSSAIQPFAASGESWHSIYTFSCVFLEFTLTLRLGPWGSIKYLDTPTGESLEILRRGGG